MTMRAWLVLPLVLLLPTAALAGDDGPIPYGDEGPATEVRGPKDPPPLRDHTRTAQPSERGWDDAGRPPPSLVHLDEPTRGVGGEAVAGVLFTERSHAGAWRGRFAAGARLHWEAGRLWTHQTVREGLFADVTWLYGSAREGTATFFVDEHQHYFTVAPAWVVHLDEARTFGLYGQLGAGMAYLVSAGRFGGAETSIAGLKPTLQYGVGLRGRPLVGADRKLRLALRAELTRFRRGWMDDTLFAASVGGVF
jgi:hypothetical protein